MPISRPLHHVCEQVFEERVVGNKREDPELQACPRILRTGDTLVVWKLDRMTRSRVSQS